MALGRTRVTHPPASAAESAARVMTLPEQATGRAAHVPPGRPRRHRLPVAHSSWACDREAWRLIGGGVGINWTELDEDLSVAGLLST